MPVGCTERGGHDEAALHSLAFRYFPSALKRSGFRRFVDVAAERSGYTGRNHFAIQVDTDVQDGDAAWHWIAELLDTGFHTMHLNGRWVGAPDPAEIF